MRSLAIFVAFLGLTSLGLAHAAHAALILRIDTHTTDELSFTISGTLDADTPGGSDAGFLALKNAWSNNVGVHTEIWSAMPSVVVNTITIGGLPPLLFDVLNLDSFGWADAVLFENPLGRRVPIAAGTPVSGSMTLSAAGAFDPSDAPTLQLVSGFSESPLSWIRLEANASLPEPATNLLLAAALAGSLAAGPNRWRRGHR